MRNTYTITTTLLALICILSLLGGCKKDDNTPTPISNGNGNGTPISANGLVTSWNPVKPYPDQVITLHGGPFNTDPAQNIVDAWGGIFTIISVNDSVLVVQPPSNMEEDYITPGGFTSLIIQSGNSIDTIPYIHWKRMVHVYHMVDNISENVFGQPCRVGDSILFAGSGFTTNGLGVVVAGSTVQTPSAVDSGYHCEASLRLPPDVFGYNEDESIIENHDITIVNSDGRTGTLTLPIGISPRARVTSFDTPVCCYSIADMEQNGTVINIELRGHNLKQCNSAQVLGPVTVPLPLPATYSDHVSWVLTPLNITPGNYTMTIKTCTGGPLSTEYFTVNP
ncbi:MAG: hypothetical protein IPI00_16635 [Flavobacteriales bacterium]|nr:hypothetical protein [Flavobacteriales bacterium]MBK6945642.1 hypothetical protein [Flavobacteriales bacterium]MBK7241748.1 hypothetical protein [Flavobacteriales bacterium]MBK7296249.1 hypothetical protein [Flavobacteriales bacterium]MBK9534806.1 hypothetical protein [Flavobacteriales bacterium]